jgi:hypothetical protein
VLRDMLEHDAGMATDDTTERSMQTDAPPGEAALDAFWAEHRLLHRKSAMCKFLGTETAADLDDVMPADIASSHADEWARAALTIAELARLRRAVSGHHVKRHPAPLPGAEHLPRCRACSCQGGGATA